MGKGAFQQLDQVSAVKPFVKASVRLTVDDDPQEVLVRMVQKARSGIPGPVHIALPVDLLNARSLPVTNRNESGFGSDANSLTGDQLETFFNIFNAARRPLILVGPYLSREKNRIKKARLCESLNSPVITLDSPRGLRDPALGGLRTLFSHADCIVYLGKPVDFTSGATDPDLIKADNIIVISESEANLDQAGRLFNADKSLLTLRADTITVTDQLIACRSSVNRSGWREAVEGSIAHRDLDDQSDAALYSKNIVDSVASVLTENPQTILICDGGEFGQWAQAFCHAQTRITNGPSGAIGGSLPYAIGAKIARPDLSVLAVMGDGTAGFHFAEFETAAREGLAINVLIGNDSRWNAEHHIQLRDYGPGRTIGCELSERTRYDIAARGLGCEGVLVEAIPQLDALLRHCFKSSGPCCINVLMPGAPAPQYTEYQTDSAE